MKINITLSSLALLCAAGTVQAQDKPYQNELGRLCWPTQYSYENGYQVISDYKNKRIILKDTSGVFRVLNISLNGSHSIRFIKNMGYLIDDTEGNRLIKLDNLSKPKSNYITKIAGFDLVRPHDILDGKDGYAYIIDENRLYRINSSSGAGEAFKLDKSAFGYARSLSLMDGKVHIISALKGKVIRIDDFQSAKVTEFTTKSHKKDDVAGSQQRTGPVLNSVIKLGNYYYGSNYFTNSYSQGSDPNPFRLIRWKTWNDFHEGAFQDMSKILPDGQVPYFMSANKGNIMITSFNHEKPCDGDSAFIIKPR